MPAFIVPLALAAIQAGVSAKRAHDQKKKAKNLKASNLTPKSVEEALASEKLRSTASSPEYLRGLEQLGQGSANTISQVKRTGGTAAQVQQAIADADARKREGVKDLQIADAGMKAQSRANTNDLLIQKGGFESQSRQQLEDAQAALRGAARTNEDEAIKSGINAAAIGAQGAIDAKAAKTPKDTGNPNAGMESFNANKRKYNVGAGRLSTYKGSNSLNASRRSYGGGTRLSNYRGAGSFNSNSRGQGLDQLDPYFQEQLRRGNGGY